MSPERGTVVLADLSPTFGHEPRGRRPCIVVSDPSVFADQRFSIACVVPISGTMGEGALYPPLRPGLSGLAKPSCALTDQIRAIDKRRILRVFGCLPTHELASVDNGIRLFLGLS
jgi:mRNA interferase MazF